MAETAYAALRSLLNTIAMEQTPRPPPHPPFPFPGGLIDTLKARVSFLVDFLEGGWKGAHHLLPRMVELAYAAEDTIESSVVDLIRPTETHTGSTFLSGQDLVTIVEYIQSIVEEVKQIQGKSGSNDLLHSSGSRSTSSSTALLSGETTKMVGFQDRKWQIMDVLTRNQSGGLRVIPIVGMGGAGKTTLARNIYNDEYIKYHFDVRAWSTISQEYDPMKILREVLSSLGRTQGNDEMDEGCLGQKVHQSLCGMRYLVILDDIWSTEAWDTLKRCFPDQNNGSCIMVTTRLSNLAAQLSTESFGINCLDEKDSWSLLCERVFGEESCPPEIEEVGKRIAENCRGLPLTIVVTGGLLANSKTLEYWTNVAHDFNSFLHLSGEDHCLQVLSLSYNELPIHLKPCFLYWAIFPEDRVVRASEIYRLWIVEGFLKPHTGKTLEEIAKEYLTELIERHLIMVEFRITTKNLWMQKRKFHIIHDQLRELCLRKAREQKFFCIVTKRSLDAPLKLNCQRRIVMRITSLELSLHKEKSEIIDSLQSASLARSLIVDAYYEEFSRVLGSPALKLLRVFYDINGLGGRQYEENVLNLVNLRCILWNIRFVGRLDSKIFSFRNLQMLVSSGPFPRKDIVPTQIWNLPHLRYVKFHTRNKLEPPVCQQEHESIILENLEALTGLKDFRFDEAILKRIPNVKKLKVRYGSECEEYWSDYSANNIRLMKKLECLDLSFEVAPNHNALVQNFAFPDSLTKLTLRGCELVWEEDMSVIGMLPNLQVLTLGRNSFTGEEWNPIDGQFRCLKRLVLQTLDVKRWNAESNHFPVLKELILSCMEHLEDIPSEIGEVPTLELIHLEWCSESLIMSAKEIVEEQQGLGNDHLLVYVYTKRRAFDGYRIKNFIVRDELFLNEIVIPVKDLQKIFGDPEVDTEDIDEEANKN